MVLGAQPGRRRLLPALGDQTTIGGVRVFHLGTPYRGRVHHTEVGVGKVASPP